MKKNGCIPLVLILALYLCLGSGAAYGQSTGAETEKLVTRNTFMTMLGQINETTEDIAHGFLDVAPGISCEKYLGWAVKNKLVQGEGNSLFAPLQLITREEAAVLLANFMKYTGVEITQVSNTNRMRYGDYQKISPWATQGVDYCISIGVINGKTEAVFDPLGGITETEAKTMLAKTKELLKSSTSQLINIKAFDGYELQGKLDLPKTAGGKKEQVVDKLVIFVNGSGPNTYENHRNTGTKEFNYFDVFAEEFAKDNTAFFRYNTRGVSLGTQPPLYSTIDQQAYQTYTPNHSVQDVESMVQALKKDPRLQQAKVYLLGWSEGTMIAPAVAKRNKVAIDGLLLAGYCNEQMETILAWQQNGGYSMVVYRQYFDSDQNGVISKAEFAQDPYGLVPTLGATFAEIDVNKDGSLTQEDFAILLEPNKKALFAAIEAKDDLWLRENYGVILTSNWFWDHRSFAPNKEVLPTLTTPIHIFHGTWDANVSVQGVYEIKATFDKLGKTNLTTHIYEGADHDLNYLQYVLYGTLPQGLQDIFKVCRDF